MRAFKNIWALQWIAESILKHELILLINLMCRYARKGSSDSFIEGNSLEVTIYCVLVNFVFGMCMAYMSQNKYMIFAMFCFLQSYHNS